MKKATTGAIAVFWVGVLIISFGLGSLLCSAVGLLFFGGVCMVIGLAGCVESDKQHKENQT